jgi:hypothetical protein
MDIFYCGSGRRASSHSNLVDRSLFFDQCPFAGDLIKGAGSMATVVASAADRKSSERKFYSRMAIFLAALVLIGFGPSFFLKDIVPPFPRPNPTLPPAVVLHGAVFTLWMLAIVAQTQLISAKKHAVHMKLGKLTVLLAVFMIPIMYLAAVWQVARANQPPFTDPLTWTIVPLAVIIPFSVLIGQGWAKRRDVQSHKRLMLSAAIITVMGPTLGRMPIAPPTLVGFTIVLLLGLALFVPLFIWDRKTIGRTHPATMLGFSMGAVTVALPLFVWWFDLPWAKVATHLPGVGA